ncbi:HK97 gp10 family phage protein [Niallia sp. Man26]|uniref:HK97 gp10 family phage protein n=1 Tax=Niallia sp. Man26 TaxID=2912824 RepID=UPI001EDA8291|nr:HK97 gp10 family phage protein [Niallia sp. Man26]UPO88335.1 HK97 gp10 family phage protein [Niallia sp. Man26]
MVSINNISQEIMRQLGIYTEEVKGKIKVSQEEIGREGVKILKRDSPKRAGEYRKGWRLKKTKDKVIIHNATHHQLTHLLEKGHANAIGGGRTPAHIHISPVEEKVVDEFLGRVESDIQS